MEEINALVEAFLKAGFTQDQIKEELTQYLKETYPERSPLDGLPSYEYQGITIRTYQDTTGRVVLFNDFETNVMTEREKVFALENHDNKIAHAESYKHTKKPRATRIPEDHLDKAKAIYKVELAFQKHGAFQRTSTRLKDEHNIPVSADALKTSWLKIKES
jgi:hypothetical protein